MASAPIPLPLAAGQAGINLFVLNPASLSQVSGAGVSVWSSSHISTAVPQVTSEVSLGRSVLRMNSNLYVADGTRGHFCWQMLTGALPNRFRMMFRYANYVSVNGVFDPCVFFASNNSSGSGHYGLVYNFLHNATGVVCNKIEAGSLVGSVAVPGLGGSAAQGSPGTRIIMDVDFTTPVVTSPNGTNVFTSVCTTGSAVAGVGGCSNALYGVFAAGWDGQVLSRVGFGGIVAGTALTANITCDFEEFVIQRHPLDW